MTAKPTQMLTNILEYKLDGAHSEYRDILYNNNTMKWEDFISYNDVDDIKISSIPMNRLNKLWNFISYVKDDNDDGINFHKPITWTHQMYNDWCSKYKITRDGSSNISKTPLDRHAYIKQLIDLGLTFITHFEKQDQEKFERWLEKERCKEEVERLERDCMPVFSAPVPTFNNSNSR